MHSALSLHFTGFLDHTMYVIPEAVTILCMASQEEMIETVIPVVGLSILIYCQLGAQYIGGLWLYNYSSHMAHMAEDGVLPCEGV